MAKICKCGNITVEKQIKLERNINERRIIFKNVPVSVCPNCNEQYLSAKTLKQMDRLLSKNLDANEINFESDPKEVYLLMVMKKMQEQNVILPGRSSDMPTTVSDVVFVLDRLELLKQEQMV